MIEFKEKLKGKMDSYVQLVYTHTECFPRSEEYGLKSQLRRSGLSVVLNHIEGYARRKPKSQLYFMEIAYGSLKESEYLIEFSGRNKYIEVDNVRNMKLLADEIGAMLWTEIKNLDNKLI